MSGQSFIRNAGSPRAFISSSIAADAFKESTSSKDYGSEQIQVNQLPFVVYMFRLLV